MKILMIANRHFPAQGGSEEVQKSLTKIMSDLGHEVTVLATNYKYAHGEEKIENVANDGNAKIIRFRSFRIVRDPFTFSPQMYKWVLDHSREFDLVYTFTYGYHTSIIPILLKKLGKLKLPVVFQPHYGPNKSLPRIVSALFDLTLGRFTVNNADRIVLLTPKYLGFFKKLGAKPDSVFIIPPLVPKISIVPGSVQIEIKNKFDIPHDKKYLISVGRVVKYKGIQFVIDGLNKLRSSSPTLFHKYHLVVAGDGDYLEQLKQQARDLNLTDKITFTGRVTDEDREIIYNLGDIFTFLSYSGESFGLVIVEAMSVGNPVIGSNEGAVDAVVSNGFNGILVDYKKPEELVNALEELDSNLKLYSDNAIESAKKYSSENVKDMLSKLLDSLSN